METIRSRVLGYWSELIFIVLPLLLMALVKFKESGIKEVVMSSDWSLVSSILYGQAISSMAAVLASRKKSAVVGAVKYYIARRVALLVLSLWVFFYMLESPSIYLGAFQILLLLYSLLRFFQDREAAFRLGEDDEHG